MKYYILTTTKFAEECITYLTYGSTQSNWLANINVGDMIFLSQFNYKSQDLFGPFRVTKTLFYDKTIIYPQQKYFFRIQYNPIGAIKKIGETDLYLRGIESNNIAAYFQIINLIQQNKHLHCMCLTKDEGEAILNTFLKIGIEYANNLKSSIQSNLKNISSNIDCEYIYNKNKRNTMIATKVFLTKGCGVHKDKLASFELALRDAGIEKCNLVYVSSIFPPKAKMITKEKGLCELHPGQITFCVMARNETSEPNRLVSASIGVAVPKDENQYGYLSEHHAFGETAKKTGEYAEDLAATMLATTLGVEFDADKAWEEREQIYKASGHIIKTTHHCQSAEGNKDGLWTTTISAAVFIDDSDCDNGK